MEEFSTSLVREKIIFTGDATAALPGHKEGEPVVIRSNRMFLRLGRGAEEEKVVIRTQNMHTTLRFAAKVLYGYLFGGPISTRATPFNWEDAWDVSLSSYEKEYNKEAWAAAYINGKSSFKTQTSPFVDVIEKCALLSLDNYDATMNVTQTALKKIGHEMRIDHASNVAAVFTDNGETMRCGIVHRSDNRDVAFHFLASGGDQRGRITQSFGATAAFLEAFNLRFTIKTLRAKIKSGAAKAASPENSQIRSAVARQGAINKAISAFEDTYEVRYRPAKPDFFSEV